MDQIDNSKFSMSASFSLIFSHHQHKVNVRQEQQQQNIFNTTGRSASLEQVTTYILVYIDSQKHI